MRHYVQLVGLALAVYNSDMFEQQNPSNQEGSSSQPPYVPLTDLNIPELSMDQANKFSLESVHSQKIMDFNISTTHDKLISLNNKKVIGIDFSNDQQITKLFSLQNGKFVTDSSYEDTIEGEFGKINIESLEKTASFSSENNIPVGISWSGPLEETRPLEHPKAKIFLNELRQRYSGDFKNVIPNLMACINNGPAGIMSAATESKRIYDNTSDVIFIINDGGLGAAVLNNNVIYSTEAGHIEGDQSLNYYKQDIPCSVYGALYTCLEQLGSGRAGLEIQWELITGERISIKEIVSRYKLGNVFATELLDHSALIIANMAFGIARAYDIALSDKNTVIAGHGQMFDVLSYSDRVKQILDNNLKSGVNFIATKDYVDTNSNAYLEGAAIAALIAQKPTNL